MEFETIRLKLQKNETYGFGMALKGGIDNSEGILEIVVADVIPDGPSFGKIKVGDRIVAVNGQSFGNVTHNEAIQHLRLAGTMIDIIVQRPLVQIPKPRKTTQRHNFQNVGNVKKHQEGDGVGFSGPATAIKIQGISLSKSSLMDSSYGFEIASQIYISNVNSNSIAYANGIRTGQLLTHLNGIDASLLSVNDARNLLKRDSIVVGVSKDIQRQGDKQSSKHTDVVDGVFKVLMKDKAVETVSVAAGSKNDSAVQNCIANAEFNHNINVETFVLCKHEKHGAGIRLSGGNQWGIFVVSVQEGSPAHACGILEGDMILRVNEVSLKGKTKEEAVLTLIAQKGTFSLSVSKDDGERYREFMASSTTGDHFFVRANFSLMKVGVLPINPGFIFEVLDTLVGGIVGNWQAMLVHPRGIVQVAGMIPNRNRAEQLSLTESSVPFDAEIYHTLAKHIDINYENRKPIIQPFVKNTKKKHASSKLNHGMTKPAGHPAYDRVTQKFLNFRRPVIIFGPLAKNARTSLLDNFPDLFVTPDMYDDNVIDAINTSNGVVELGYSDTINIRHIQAAINDGKHCLLDLTPRSAYRLSLSRIVPIIILMEPQDKKIFKEIFEFSHSGQNKNSASSSNKGNKSERKVLQQIAWAEMMDLKENWSALFHEVITILSADDAKFWYYRILETIQRLQKELVWVPVSNVEEEMAEKQKNKVDHTTKTEQVLMSFVSDKKEPPPLLTKPGKVRRSRQFDALNIATSEDEEETNFNPGENNMLPLKSVDESPEHILTFDGIQDRLSIILAEN